ncbi:MAG: radical SAM protein [Candidatus Nanoarchaeia archaeon]|nr:radical SAM protein [Candidatus Nanoarchaeia archaeon]
MQIIQKTPYKSYCAGTLPKGCQMCVRGEKEVIFVTGVCSRQPACYFCPISDQKYGKDVIYANEMPLSDLKEIIHEARLCESKGAGLTGGDPLSRLDRTLEIIKMLKNEFGNEFHIHLYTPLELVTPETIRKLEEAGLDEIRFHPSLDDNSLWARISVKTTMAKGVEIPVIPGKEEETKKLIDFIKDKVSFLNLNELEISDTNVNKLYEHKFEAKNDISYAVKGSEEMALELTQYAAKNTSLDVHYCTVALKDTVQLPKRIARRAKNVKQKFDLLTKEDTLIRGAAYFLEPSFGYNEKVRNMAADERERIISKLNEIMNELIAKHKVNADAIAVDDVKLRLLMSRTAVQNLKKDLKAKGLYPAVVEDLPTYDEFEIESEEI